MGMVSSDWHGTFHSNPTHWRDFSASENRISVASRMGRLRRSIESFRIPLVPASDPAKHRFF